MSYLFPLLIVLFCPLMMIWMMRGMGGGHADHSAPSTRSDSVDSSQTRLAELEREVAELRAARDTQAGHPDPSRQ